MVGLGLCTLGNDNMVTLVTCPELYPWKRTLKFKAIKEILFLVLLIFLPYEWTLMHCALIFTVTIEIQVKLCISLFQIIFWLSFFIGICISIVSYI